MTPLPYDILYIIFSFLTYSERTRCLRLCRFMKEMTIDRFLGTTVSPIEWPGRHDPSYLIVYHPYSTPCIHPSIYLGHHYVSFILYDSPSSYFHFRCMRPYEEGKTLSHYLSHYHSETDDVKHILHAIESDLP